MLILCPLYLRLILHVGNLSTTGSGIRQRANTGSNPVQFEGGDKDQIKDSDRRTVVSNATPPGARKGMHFPSRPEVQKLV